MKKTLITTLVLILAITVFVSNKTKLVIADDLGTSTSKTQETKEISESNARLIDLNNKISNQLNDSSLNALIFKNLSRYQSKANAVLAMDPATQVESEVLALADSIELALTDIQYNVSLNELEQMMALSLISYDKTSSTNYASLVQLAKEMLNTIDNEINANIPLVTLTKVPTLVTDLNSAKEVMVKNDYTAINVAIAESKKINLAMYTPTTAQLLKDALVKANEALTIEISAKDLSIRTKALIIAVDGLEALMIPEQKAILDSFLIKVKNFNDSKHSTASKKLIYDMDSKVKTFLNKDVKPLLEAERLLQEITQIENLMANPEIKEPNLVNKSDLNAAIKKASKYIKSAYSNESWIIFEEKLVSAKDVFNNETVLQEMVDMALGNLNKAMLDLKSKPGSKPVVHPFDEIPEYIYVGDSFKLPMGNSETITFDELIFDVIFGSEVTFTAKAPGMSEIKYTDSNGIIIKYQIETRERDKSNLKEDTELPDVGITPDNSQFAISSTLIISGIAMILLSKKQKQLI